MSEVKDFSKPLITVFLILGLLITMPAFLISPGTYYTGPDLPDFFTGTDVSSYDNYYNVTLDLTGFSAFTTGLNQLTFTLGSEDFILILPTSLTYLQVGRIVWGSIFGLHLAILGYDWLKFTNARGTARGVQINNTELDGDYLLSANHAVIKYHGVAQDTPSVTMDLFLGWNITGYDLPSEALLDETMIFLGASGLNETQTSINGIGLVLALLTFQMPNVPYPFNYLIGGLLYIPIIVLGLFIYEKLKPFG